MRGEDVDVEAHRDRDVGSPPHARGRRRCLSRRPRRARITPACAGKTHLRSTKTHAHTDHPRMRGEDSPRRRSTSTASGSPPHARGRRRGSAPTRLGLRITPACAGKTVCTAVIIFSFPDHPRMRGEDVSTPLPAEDDGDHPRMRGEDPRPDPTRYKYYGSPPHARGRLVLLVAEERRGWITPACAGKTREGRVPVRSRRDHPRMRGEDPHQMPTFE